MRILLFGKYGQLGWELLRTLAPLGDVNALDYPEIDLTDPESLRSIIRQADPQVVVNATAYTAVDRAESEPDKARAINSHSPGVMAEEAARLGAPLIHFSTDYVFDGELGRPYLESDPPNPLGVYGLSKLEGEQAVASAGGAYLVLRTSWVYTTRRDSFVTKVLQWSRQQPQLKLVTDQVGNPTWARMLAETTAAVLAQSRDDVSGWLGERRGLYHLAGSGCASRLEWGEAVLRLDPHREEQMVQEILPAQTSEFPTPARRPLYSALNCDRFSEVFGLRLPPWEAALRLAMQVE